LPELLSKGSVRAQRRLFFQCVPIPRPRVNANNTEVGLAGGDQPARRPKFGDDRK